mmetsp:Transcript_83778/g.218833  ORF Transcript_83778/g.218833 Transcript_83778/m.218833 type:complete len:214 (+) Transcript_83778:1431-2072(+)
MLLDGDVNVGVDEFHLWYFDSLLYLLDRGHVPLLHDWDVNNLINKLDLGHVHVPLYNLLDGHLLLLNLGNLPDLLLDDRLLLLHDLLLDHRLHHVDLLDLVLHRGVHHRVLLLPHLRDPLLNLNLRHLDGLLNQLWPGDFHRQVHEVLHDPLLGHDSRDVHELLDLLLHHDVYNLLHVEVVVARLLDYLGNVDDLLLRHRHGDVHGLLHWNLL